MKKEKLLYITQASIVATLYVILTYISFAFGLDKLIPQIRLSEALCVLVYFLPSAISGLFVGCIIANLCTGAMVIDVIFGSLATLLGAYLGSKIKNKWLIPIPTVVANTLIVPPILAYVYRIEQAYYLITLGVFAGEIISAYILGILLFSVLKKHEKTIFRNNKK